MVVAVEEKSVEREGNINSDSSNRIIETDSLLTLEGVPLIFHRTGQDIIKFGTEEGPTYDTEITGTNQGSDNTCDRYECD